MQKDSFCRKKLQKSLVDDFLETGGGGATSKEG